MTDLLNTFEAKFIRFNTAIAIGVAISIGIFTLLVPFDFMLRKLRVGGLEWLNEGAEYFLFFGIFLSATWVLQQGAHVRVDIVISNLPVRAAAWLERAMDLVGAVLCAIMAYLGARSTFSSYLLGTLPDKDLRIPNWIILSVFCIAFVLLTIEFLLRYRRAGQHGYVAEASAGF
ncbi:TRAP transporter small permease [Hoeflea sp. BAL378]|uniref:TRAP transporter small permease n=1 Tax=Hoeflea sp. BAL378 TaxID=1547437 RepID=UPI00068E6801|nr:TRAP transporter small permease [Hoeflea sp. BAL378]